MVIISDIELSCYEDNDDDVKALDKVLRPRVCSFESA